VSKSTALRLTYTKSWSFSLCRWGPNCISPIKHSFWHTSKREKMNFLLPPNRLTLICNGKCTSRQCFLTGSDRISFNPGTTLRTRTRRTNRFIGTLSTRSARRHHPWGQPWCSGKGGMKVRKSSDSGRKKLGQSSGTGTFQEAACSRAVSWSLKVN